MVTKTPQALYKYTVNSSNLSEQIAMSPHEVVAVIVTGGSGGAAVRIYDSTDGANEPSPSIDSFLVAANGGESTAFCPAQAIPMFRGIYIELEQGGSSNGEATILYN